MNYTFEKPILGDSRQNLAIIDRWISDTVDKLNMMQQLVRKQQELISYDGGLTDRAGSVEERATLLERDAAELRQLIEDLQSGKAPTNHASSDTTYGQGDASNYGHVKLSDTYTSSVSGANAAGGVGASQNALYNAYHTLDTAIDTANTAIATKLDHGSYSISGKKLSGTAITTGNQQVIHANPTRIYFGNPATPITLESANGSVPFDNLIYPTGTFTETGVAGFGWISSSGTQCSMYLFTNKSFAAHRTVTVTNITSAGFRSADGKYISALNADLSGYINSSNAYAPSTGTTGLVYVDLRNSSGWGHTNNIPVNGVCTLKFTVS